MTRKKVIHVLSVACAVVITAVVAILIIQTVHNKIPNQAPDSESETFVAEEEPVIEEEPETEEPTTQREYSPGLQGKIEHEILPEQEVLIIEELDYNGDGSKEAFAVVGKPKKDEDDQYEDRMLEYWFASETKCQRVLRQDYDMDYYEYPTQTIRISTTNTALSIGLGPNPGGGHMLYDYYTVNKAGEPVAILETLDGELQCSQKVDGMLYYEAVSYHGMSAIGSRYYYTYNADKGLLMQYDAIEISTNQFRKLRGAQKILSDISKEGGTVEYILYRENGIVDIEILKNETYIGRSYWIDKAKKLQPIGEEISATEPIFYIADPDEDTEEYPYEEDDDYEEFTFETITSKPKEYPY